MSQPASRAQSRASSVASDHEGGPQQSASARRRSRNRRGRSRTPRSLSASSEDTGPHDVPRRKRGGKKGGLPAVGEVDEAAGAVGNTAKGAVDTVGDVAGSVAGGGGGGDKPLKLRLDLNLEVEVTLKARVHGDLTLALFMPPSTQASSPASATGVNGHHNIPGERSPSSAGGHQVQHHAPRRRRRRRGASAKGNAVKKAQLAEVDGNEDDKNVGAIRLDLNLEVDVTLKARLRGDLTLCLE
ncbi:hypothetical protein PC9H_010700 [Pleurotus ostreatus]|uniref:Uncharacterized protein n=1 Tax=Pleurotus ostreatus TaxID=5322 RepID=A0A8H6ZN99_PLEOS|nr:uncharacterized protein PC9H_010700 [Pleurotus ostreatus]KAF7422544.1 hypothetical protein PC9H_010700 [Pleurotus ostreatus]